MNGSGRKRPMDTDSLQNENQDGQESSVTSSPINGRNKFGGPPAKGQMSLFSFGFGPSSASKKLRTDASSPQTTKIHPINSPVREAISNQQDKSMDVHQQVAQTPPKKRNQEVAETTPFKTPTRMVAQPDSPYTPSKSFRESVSNELNDSESYQPASSQEISHAHMSYDFLKADKRRDINMRRPNDPEYDPKTLHVPPHWVKKETPAMQQWWTHKQRNMDAILFFKMGKFYELFNEDAVIGVNELDLKLMRSSGPDKPAHAGFPESSRDKYEKILVDKGYKVLRIEQTETPAMMDERVRASGLKSNNKVVMREICQVTTKGTRMWGIGDAIFHSAQYQYLLALIETNSDSDISDKSEKIFGVCFVDVTIGKLFLGQFKDDNNLSNLNILLAHHSPVEILYERNNLSSDTHKTLLKTGARLEPLKSNREFWTLKKAISHLKVNRIFSSESGDFEWPFQLKNLFEDGEDCQDILSLEPREEFKFALNSFGAIVYYLHSQLIEKQVLAHASFEIYSSPLDPSSKSSRRKNDSDTRKNVAPMIMDHIALKNLELFDNSIGTSEATLFNSLNNCQTHFGQRLLKSWICAPLCDIKQIDNRLDAVKALMSNKNSSLLSEVVHMLSGTKDLERMLSKIKNHCFKSDSDTRAIMFDGNQFNKAKVAAFVTLLSNFKRIQKFIESIGPAVQNCESDVLKKLLSFTLDGGLYPDYSETVKYFEQYFDHATAQKTGQVIPADGVNKDYDECNENIRNMQAKLDEYLEQQKNLLRCKDITYFGSAKNRYQLQVPEAYVKKVPNDWRIETGRAGYKRFYTPKIDEYFSKLTIFEEQMKKILDSVLSGVFEEFLRKVKLWSAAIECVAVLDVLQSMAKFCRSLIANGVQVCRPNFKAAEGSQLIEYKNGRHPTLVLTNPNFIDNNLSLDSRTLLLSGANMGGKSTLMRQTALLVILAQLGCYVPATEFTLTPVDRIFSRLGASDRLLEGESTFYTELVETSAMLRCATKKSLLLLDELGRGTSTYDGTAIAYSVIKEISSNIQCRCLFSTHYHTLTRDFENVDEVRLAHMACKVERERYDDDVDLDPLKENITFLYKISDGPAARSYGFNVAKLAGIHDDLIREAFKKSKEIVL